MGWFTAALGRDRVKLEETVGDVAAALATPMAGYVDPSTFPVGSPWTTAELERVLFADVFGESVPINTRTAALRIATVFRAKRLICSTVSRMALRQLEGDQLTADQPAWLTAQAGGQSPQLKMAWTVDDIMFYDWSLWLRVVEGDQLVATQRVPYGAWGVTQDNRITIDGDPVRDDQVILIGGFGQGILEYGVDVLSDARALYAAVRDRIENPTPNMDLHQTGGPELTPEQRDEMLASWRLARKQKGGTVGYTPQSIEARVLESSDANQLMIEARNAAAVDLARLIGVSAGMLDATAPKASLNYETQQGRNLEFLDLDVEAYLLPIEARLSLDDVCPAGTRVAFDRGVIESLTPSPTGPNLAD